MPDIQVEKLSRYYRNEHAWRLPKAKRREIGVEDINLSIRQGEFVFVIGSCGAGKSTLLNLISGQDKPSAGKVMIDGKRVSKVPRSKRGKSTPDMGYVHQRYQLDHGKMVEEILEEAAKPGFWKFHDRRDCSKRIHKVLGLTGLSGREFKYPIELTYGERRRLELAVALINSPSILVLDEITAGLDPDSMWDVFLLLDEINRMGITIIMATHSSFYVNMSRKRVVTLVHGRVYSDEQKGRFGEVNPKQQNPKGGKPQPEPQKRGF